MKVDSARGRAGSKALTPMGIAQHPLFTAREKLDLLQRIKSEVAAAPAGSTFQGFGTSELDAAMAEVRRTVESRAGLGQAMRGEA